MIRPGLRHSWSVPLLAASVDLVAIAPHLPSMLPRLTRPGPRAGRVPLPQTVSAVDRTETVAKATKIASQTTRPTARPIDTLVLPITSVPIFTAS